MAKKFERLERCVLLFVLCLWYFVFQVHLGNILEREGSWNTVQVRVCMEAVILLFRAVFAFLSKVICVCFSFALLRLVIGLKILCHFLNQSEVKPKPILTRSCTFSRASRQQRISASGFDWLKGLSVSFVVGWSDYFGFNFLQLIWKLLYCPGPRTVSV